jgi:hypothetical protein
MMGVKSSDLFTIEEPTNLRIKYRNVDIECKGEDFKMMELLAKDLLHKLNIDKVDRIKFPINKIDGLKCESILLITYSYNLHKDDYNMTIIINIMSNTIMYNDSTNEKNYFIEKIYNKNNKIITIIDIIEILLIMKYLFYNLKYCYISNMLELNTYINVELFTSIIDNPNIEILGEKCCVCFITTTNKTPCKHSLCFKCWEEIKPQQVEEEEQGYEETILPCPLCRQNIYYIHHN